MRKPGCQGRRGARSAPAPLRPWPSRFRRPTRTWRRWSRWCTGPGSGARSCASGRWACSRAGRSDPLDQLGRVRVQVAGGGGRADAGSPPAQRGEQREPSHAGSTVALQQLAQLATPRRRVPTRPSGVRSPARVSARWAPARAGAGIPPRTPSIPGPAPPRRPPAQPERAAGPPPLLRVPRAWPRVSGAARAAPPHPRPARVSRAGRPARTPGSGIGPAIRDSPAAPRAQPDASGSWRARRPRTSRLRAPPAGRSRRRRTP